MQAACHQALLVGNYPPLPWSSLNLWAHAPYVFVWLCQFFHDLLTNLSFNPLHIFRSRPLLNWMRRLLLIFTLIDSFISLYLSTSDLIRRNSSWLILLSVRALETMSFIVFSFARHNETVISCLLTFLEIIFAQAPLITLNLQPQEVRPQSFRCQGRRRWGPQI